MKTTKLFVLAGLALAICSCDPGTSADTIIKNKTDESLEVNLFSTNQEGVKKRVLIAEPKGDIVLFHDSGLGYFGYVFPQDLDLDSIRFVFSEYSYITFTDDSLGKNPFNHDDWIQKEKKAINMHRNFTLIFEVYDEDILDWQ